MISHIKSIIGPGSVSSGGGLPSGGITGNIIVKQSAAEGDADWQTPGSGSAYVEVANFAALPDPTTVTGETYSVLAGTGFDWNKRRGFYRSNGTIWKRLSGVVFDAKTNELSIRDFTDTTKIILFNASGIPTLTSRTITLTENANLDHIAVNTIHKDSDGKEHSDVVLNNSHRASDHAPSDANNYSHPNHTGEVTSTGDGATVIINNAVTLAKMADMATASVLGRNTAATGDPEVLSMTTLRTMLNIEDGADVTDTVNVNSAGAVMESDYNANTILAATSDDTPITVTVAEQTLLGRITAGNITALTTTQVKTLLGLVIGIDVHSFIPEVTVANEGTFNSGNPDGTLYILVP